MDNQLRCPIEKPEKSNQRVCPKKEDIIRKRECLAKELKCTKEKLQALLCLIEGPGGADEKTYACCQCLEYINESDQNSSSQIRLENNRSRNTSQDKASNSAEEKNLSRNASQDKGANSSSEDKNACPVCVRNMQANECSKCMEYLNNVDEVISKIRNCIDELCSDDNPFKSCCQKIKKPKSTTAPSQNMVCCAEHKPAQSSRSRVQEKSSDTCCEFVSPKSAPPASQNTGCCAEDKPAQSGNRRKAADDLPDCTCPNSKQKKSDVCCTCTRDTKTESCCPMPKRGNC